MTTLKEDPLAAETAEVRRKVLDFARRELQPDVIRRDSDGRSSIEAWRAAAELGLHRLLVPSVGTKANLLTVITVMEAIGAGCEDGGFALSLVAHAFGCAFPIYLAAITAQRAELLAKLQAGTLVGACAMTEAASGSDAFSMQATGVRNSGDYLLTGEKLYVTNGPSADIFLVYARTDAGPGPFGATAFLVERGSMGLMIEPGPMKLGVRTAQWATVRLEQCRVSETARVGAEGSAGALFREAMKWERIALSAASLGAMQSSLDRCVTFVRHHRRFGHTLSQFQSISHRIVDMRVRLEACRALLSEVVRDQKNGSPREDLVAILKIFVNEASFQSGYDEVHLRGADGISMESGASLLMRNALALQSASGTEEVQRLFIAASMGLK